MSPANENTSVALWDSSGTPEIRTCFLLWCSQAVTLLFLKGLVQAADKSVRRHLDLIVASLSLSFGL